MTRKPNARVAGFTLLLCIAQHASDAHLAVVLTLCPSFAALTLDSTRAALESARQGRSPDAEDNLSARHALPVEDLR